MEGGGVACATAPTTDKESGADTGEIAELKTKIEEMELGLEKTNAELAIYERALKGKSTVAWVKKATKEIKELRAASTSDKAACGCASRVEKERQVAPKKITKKGT